MATKTKSVPTSLAATVRAAVGNPGMQYQWGSAVAVAYFPTGHAAYDRVARGLPASPAPLAGLLRIEMRQRHSDALSVAGGMLLQSTDTMAVAGKSLWVRQGDDDLAHLLRADGGLARFIG
jgi:hypothetical protein